MRIWHISDTHGYHDLLKVPEGIDTVIFSGDAGNVRSPYHNEHEVRSFLLWFSMLDIPLKIMIAGNHDSAIEKKLITSKQMLEDYKIMYLEDESVEFDGIKFWGSPWTPTFNDWSFNRNRSKLHKLWESIPKDTDVVITHGPPKGILDISDNYDHGIEFCGCSAFRKQMIKLEPIVSLFGHIHDFKEHRNAGWMKISGTKTWFSNAVAVTDRKFGTLSSNGNVFEINGKEKTFKIIENN